MTGNEPGPSGIGSDRTVNCVAIIAQPILLIVIELRK